MEPKDDARPRDDLDRALSDLLQYLGLESMVAAELNVIARPMNKVIAALLTSQERNGELSPYRQHLLESVRKAGAVDQGTGR